MPRDIVFGYVAAFLMMTWVIGAIWAMGGMPAVLTFVLAAEFLLRRAEIRRNACIRARAGHAGTDGDHTIN